MKVCWLIDKNMKKVVFIFLFGFILRFIFAYLYPVTLDEAWSFYSTKLEINDLIKILKEDATSPGLIYFIHRLFDFSKTEFGIRWFFFLLNVFSVSFIYRLTQTSLFSLLISSFSFFLIKEGTLARMHSVSLFFSSLIVYSWIKYFDVKEKKYLIIFLASSFLLSFNFYQSLVVPVSLFLVWFCFERKNWNYFFYSILVVAFFFISVFIFIDFNSLKSMHIHSSIKFPTGGFIGYFIYSFVFSEELISYGEIKSFKLLIFLLLFAFLFFIFIQGVKESLKEKKGKTIFWAFVISIFTIFIFSIKIPKLTYSSKYMISLFPLFIYIFDIGVRNVNLQLKRLFISIFVIMNFLSFVNAFYNNKEDWRKVAEFVKERVVDEDVILVYREQMGMPFSFYYSGDFISLPNNKTDVSNLIKVIKDRKILWYINSHDFINDGLYYEEAIKKYFTLKEFYDYKDIKIFKYERKLIK